MSMQPQSQLAVWVGPLPESQEGRNYRSLDEFLAGVERRAYVMAEIATRNAEEALDLVQEAMLAFVSKYSEKAQDEWPPLFHRVLQNKIRDWHRRQQVRNRWRAWVGGPRDGEEENDPIQRAPDPRARTPEMLVALSDGTDALMAAISDLPERQQQAFMLRTWEGLDVAQTATAMGCSGGTVKTHLSRAMQCLRRKLEDHWE